METERKYLQPDFAKTRQRLIDLGATSEGPHFEINTVFDTSDLSLYAAGRLLRLRLQEWPDHSRSVLTFKYPCALVCKSVKAREELELGVENGQTMALVLAQLGYKPVAKYEKMREAWQVEFAGYVYAVDFDTLPFGEVIETEGDPAGLDALARALGLDKTKISLKTYHELNQEWRTDNGLEKKRDLLFEAAARARLRASLDLAAD